VTDPRYPLIGDSILQSKGFTLDLQILVLDLNGKVVRRYELGKKYTGIQPKSLSWETPLSPEKSK